MGARWKASRPGYRRGGGAHRGAAPLRGAVDRDHCGGLSGAVCQPGGHWRMYTLLWCSRVAGIAPTATLGELHERAGPSVPRPSVAHDRPRIGAGACVWGSQNTATWRRAPIIGVLHPPHLARGRPSRRPHRRPEAGPRSVGRTPRHFAALSATRTVAPAVRRSGNGEDTCGPKQGPPLKLRRRGASFPGVTYAAQRAERGGFSGLEDDQRQAKVGRRCRLVG